MAPRETKNAVLCKPTEGDGGYEQKSHQAEEISPDHVEFHIAGVQPVRYGG